MENNQQETKVWKIALFALNNASTNIIHCMMAYITYYASGVAGILLLTISYALTYMRVFDAITDPAIGYLMDKLNFGKWGKFRPWMLAGHIIMSGAVLILYNTAHNISESYRLWYLVGWYAIYIVGYTCQTTCTRAAQACLTKSEKQRPLFSLFDSLYSIFVFGGTSIFVSNVLQPKHGGFTLEFFQEFAIIAIGIATICTILAIIGLWGQDVAIETEDKAVEKTKLQDYILVLKNNSALRKLVMCAGIDKLAAQCVNNSITGVVLFGIIVGDYSFYGKMTVMAVPPMICIAAIGTKASQKLGMRKVIITMNSLGLVVLTTLACLTYFGNLGNIGLGQWDIFGMAFIVLFALTRGLQMFGTTLFTPMVADCIDYEEYLSGKQMPGMIGSLYSFVDKLVSSLAATVVGTAVAMAGFREAAPEVGATLTPELLYAGIFCAFGFQILSACFVIYNMVTYPLTSEKMQEVQLKLNK
ncbi:MAG: hypothetical protein ATN35_11255 [Epulopiscium sp. Nele67-Bin004]|nr:MAG: hypothetical protein ATN35_11255 [Epulopiscium sp. Nele67-Bin004]